MIAWGQGVLDCDQVLDKQACYPINILKNLLKEHPELPKETAYSQECLETIRNYFLFTIKVDEDIPLKVLFTIFEFLHDVINDKHSHSLSEYYGDFPTDILFKNYLNVIVDVFDLKYLIDSMWFCDNCYSITLKYKILDQDDTLEKLCINMKKMSLLNQAIKWCEKKTRSAWNEFFVSLSFD